MTDKFAATWVSHSSIGDFLNCPRGYFLKNVWKRPETGHKVQISSPPASLGLAVHDVLESLSILPAQKRFQEPLVPKLEIAWEKYTGKLGGFFDVETEYRFKTKAEEMIRKVEKNPGPLTNLAVKIEMNLPYFWLSEELNIILCGKIDWLEYLKETDSVNIIDFKTGKHEESPDSLQLPIYVLLVNNCQKRKVEGAFYWYLDSSDKPVQKTIPDIDKAQKQILKIAKDIKLARTLNKLKCLFNGCPHCEPLEKIFKGEGEFVGINSFGQDCFVLPQQAAESREGVIV